MLRGAFLHEFGHDHEHEDPFGLNRIHFPDHHGDDDGGGIADADDLPITWGFDNVELVTVGVDVGSSTSHLLFARLHLQRLSQSLSSRFAVVKREVLHRSDILLTPYRPDGLIDVDALQRFFEQAYARAAMRPEAVDTGAVILTGAALERANARAVADLFAAEGGKFVCASAGHNLEAILAAHGSGAVALSHRRGDTLLHVDVGGGTSKLSLVRDGDILETAAIGVGGRLVAVDEQGRVVRIEHAAQTIARDLGMLLEMGQPLSTADQGRLAGRLVDVLLDAMSGRDHTGLTSELLLTEPMTFAAGRPAGVTFSGGVSEYIYQRASTAYGDLAPSLADSLRAAERAGRLPAEVVELGEGIRATVIGASQFSVQLSGNTVHISNPTVLPLRNLPVVHPRLPADADLDEASVAAAIRVAFRRLDLEEGEQPVALSLSWAGEPYYRTLRALAGGIASALPRSIRAGFPLTVALQGDIGRSLGGILEEECAVVADLVCIDGLHLVELDYVDVGEVIHPADVVPVVVKSLAFSATDVRPELVAATVASPR